MTQLELRAFPGIGTVLCSFLGRVKVMASFTAVFSREITSAGVHRCCELAYSTPRGHAQCSRDTSIIVSWVVYVHADHARAVLVKAAVEGCVFYTWLNIHYFEWTLSKVFFSSAGAI